MSSTVSECAGRFLLFRIPKWSLYISPRMISCCHYKEEISSSCHRKIHMRRLRIVVLTISQRVSMAELPLCKPTFNTPEFAGLDTLCCPRHAALSSGRTCPSFNSEHPLFLHPLLHKNSSWKRWVMTPVGSTPLEIAVTWGILDLAIYMLTEPRVAVLWHRSEGGAHAMALNLACGSISGTLYRLPHRKDTKR